MIAPDAAIATLEQLLNRYLNLDPEALRHLHPMQGRIICIELTGLNLRLFLIPGPTGFQVFGRYDGAPDCVLRGPPLALGRMRRAQRKEDQLFAGTVEIQGDTQLAQRFGEFLGRLDIDWEEQLSRVIGDPAAHQVGRTARGVRRWMQETGDTLVTDLGEYLQEESRLAPSPYEVEDFLSQVDLLRDDLERLAARIDRVQDSLPEDPDGLQ